MAFCDRGEEEELEQLKGLDEIDVTDSAEDDEQLKRKFEEMVYHFLVLILQRRS